MTLPRIALVCPRLQLPDAVGYDVLHEARVFADAGYRVKIFAGSWSPQTPAEALGRVADWLRSPEDVLLYHYSVHAPEILELLRSIDCRRVLRYHNVTPAEFLESYDRAFVNALRAGRELLGGHLATGVTLALADSTENQRDLLAAGALPEICKVVAPFHRVPELLAGPADADWLRALEGRAATTQSSSPGSGLAGPGGDGAGLRNILMVGRIVPNKGYAHLIRGFAALSARRRDCRLILAGGHDQRLHLYYRELRSIIEESGVADRVWIPGSVSLGALRALYRTADLLAVVSEHEGFCLPLVEAMAHGVPIAALNRTAIPDTLGDGGLLLESTEPAYLAAAFQKLLSEPELAQKIGAQGRARYAAHFTNERLADNLLNSIHEYVSHRPAHSPSTA